MNVLKSTLYGFGIYFVIFLGYLELSPSLTNIWYRIGSDGYRHINLDSLWYFIMKPFEMIELWYPKYWDINYFVGATITSIACYYLFYK